MKARRLLHPPGEGARARHAQAVAAAAADATVVVVVVHALVGRFRRLQRKAPRLLQLPEVDQQLTDDIGAFFRFSWNDGRSEILAFTDIDSSVSGGLSIKGAAWNRPDDTVGLGAAVNSITPSHQNFLAAGGLGLTTGDGALMYAAEYVAEAYYSLKVAKGVYVTADYQYLGNPAYNAVRGPAHFFSGRLMAKF